jgi:hypothetical protein
VIELGLHDLSWINDAPDDPDDFCAHGRVALTVSGTAWITPDEGKWTVSAAGLFLLRTLTDDHTPENPVAEVNQLFACCGSDAWLCGTRYPVLCMGCASGIDVYVRHLGNDVELRRDKRRAQVPLVEWREATLAFCRVVRQFYAACTPKVPRDAEEDRLGWEGFWTEWDSRVKAAAASES